MTCQPSPAGHPCPSSRVDAHSTDLTIHTMNLKLPPSLQLRDYYVIATDPTAGATPDR